MKIKNLSIRQANENDCVEIGRLYYETVRTINAKDYTEKEIEIWSGLGKKLEVWKRKVSEQYFLVAVSDGMIVGISSIENNILISCMFIKIIREEELQKDFWKELKRKQ